MSWQPELENTLQAWYDFEACAASEKDSQRAAFNRLWPPLIQVDAAVKAKVETLFNR